MLRNESCITLIHNTLPGVITKQRLEELGRPLSLKTHQRTNSTLKASVCSLWGCRFPWLDAGLCHRQVGKNGSLGGHVPLLSRVNKAEIKETDWSDAVHSRKQSFKG